MPIPSVDETIAESLKLLREGQVQAADDLLTKARADLEAAAKAASGQPEEPPPPRSPEEIFVDFAREVCLLLGSAAPLVKLLAEYEASKAV